VYKNCKHHFPAKIILQIVQAGYNYTISWLLAYMTQMF